MKTFQLLMIAMLLTSCGLFKPKPPAPIPTGPLPPAVQPSGVTRGLTLDSVAKLDAIVESLKAMPFKPMVRIVFDYPEEALSYKDAVQKISLVATIIGQPSDSEYAKQMTVQQYEDRFKEYVYTLPEIPIWETCNECNGDWAGENTPKQAEVATKVVKGAGRKAMYIPYWNTEDCLDEHGEYKKWTQQNISTYVKQNTDYVAVSVYGMDCEGSPEPSHAQLDKELDFFKVLFPNAHIGIGEYGADAARERIYNIKREDVMLHYLTYPRTGFGGYWYGAQHLVPKDSYMWNLFVK